MRGRRDPPSPDTLLVVCPFVVVGEGSLLGPTPILVVVSSVICIDGQVVCLPLQLRELLAKPIDFISDLERRGDGGSCEI
jgi:hypothetical protein